MVFPPQPRPGHLHWRWPYPSPSFVFNVYIIYAVCLGSVRRGQGRAIFTADCSHSFHFNCIVNNVKHGNYLCPICRLKWKEIPFQLTRAVCFVIENLGPSDRLSIVSFSGNALRLFPLRWVTNIGREDANGGTKIVFKTGPRVLAERRQENSVSSIVLLSDGKDAYNYDNLPTHLEFLKLEDQTSNFPVNTFGFGSDHDSSTMHAISDASGGTFSFIESVSMVQDAFARCIGGLLTSLGLQIGSIPSWSYPSEISEQGLEGVINVGDLYADDEKEFQFYLSVPDFQATTRGDSTTTHTSILREGGSSNHSGSIGYYTPSMVSMVSKSKTPSALNSREHVQRHHKSRSLTRM
ncbi:hypothetical protein ACJIZ3_008507 [Penstemon smallii]|uniref:RING-type domain-containing protein n=1 Tax=Penstemon smallii TaxID=265156 RepID=A0ABD3TAW4_9LAMI